ncbi:glycosyltransferase [Celeribacter sp. ULVN23_4]
MSFQDVAVIVEWENALLAELARPKEMLRRLQAQAVPFAQREGCRFHLVIAYNPEDVDVAVPQGAVAECIDAESWPGTVSFLNAGDRHYYALKNHAVAQRSEDMILFVDSDVIPEEGWLEALLTPFHDPQVQVVGGNTYMDVSDAAGQAFSLFWFFKPQRDLPDLADRRTFFANNLAIRKATFDAHPFPEAGAYRGQCNEMARALSRDGIAIKSAGKAWMSHPAPNGMGHFLNRAAAKGFDNVYWSRQRKVGWLKASPIGALFRLLRSLVQLPQRIWARNRVLRLGVSGGALGALGGLSYTVIVFLSELVSWIAPGFVKRHVSV